MFKIVNTFKNAASPQNAQRGQPAPGSGAQQTNPARKAPGEVPWYAMVDYQGTDTWPSASADTYGNPQFPVDAQRGQPVANAPGIARPRGSVVNGAMDGTTRYRETPNFSRGMQRFAVNTPILIQNANPGDIVPAKPRVVPNYPLGQYINNTIFFANQVIPTSIPLAGLQTQKSVEALLSTFFVEGKYDNVP
jgi:hypothetical protein